jgi:hypothetical protein
MMRTRSRVRMNSRSSRRFGLLDGIILITATAIGLVMAKPRECFCAWSRWPTRVVLDSSRRDDHILDALVSGTPGHGVAKASPFIAPPHAAAGFHRGLGGIDGGGSQRRGSAYCDRACGFRDRDIFERQGALSLCGAGEAGRDCRRLRLVPQAITGHFQKGARWLEGLGWALGTCWILLAISSTLWDLL